MAVTERPSLDHDRLRAVPGGVWNDVQIREVAESTNDEAAALARAGSPEGTVVVAEHQRAGRGRLDRRFVLPPHSSLPVSFLLRPDGIELARWPWLIFVSGLAVCDVVESVGGTPQVKWPNDVLVDGLKISGINMEHVTTPSGGAAVVGIGLNVLQTREELPVETATSLALVTGESLDRTEILLRLLAAFGERYARWRDAGGDPAVVRAEYERRCSSIGHRVRVHLPDGSVTEGLASGIDGDGRIVVDGRPFSAGDIVHLRPGT